MYNPHQFWENDYTICFGEESLWIKQFKSTFYIRSYKRIDTEDLNYIKTFFKKHSNEIVAKIVVQKMLKA